MLLMKGVVVEWGGKQTNKQTTKCQWEKNWKRGILYTKYRLNLGPENMDHISTETEGKAEKMDTHGGRN